MIFPNKILHALYSGSSIQGRKKGSRESTSVENAVHLFNCLFVSTCLSNLPVSPCQRGGESRPLWRAAYSVLSLHLSLTISSCPPVSLTYLSLSLSKGKRASTSVETCLHLSNCLCLSTCLSNPPVSLTYLSL